MEQTLEALFSREDRGEVLFSYCGQVTAELTLLAFEKVDASPGLAGETPELKRRVFRAFVESLQNLFHHGEFPDSELPRRRSGGYGCIVLRKMSGGYGIFTGNYLPRGKGAALRQRLEEIRDASPETLKERTLHRLQSEAVEGGAGGGTGLLSLAVLAETLDYSIVSFGTSQSLFTLRLDIG